MRQQSIQTSGSGHDPAPVRGFPIFCFTGEDADRPIYPIHHHWPARGDVPWPPWQRARPDGIAWPHHAAFITVGEPLLAGEPAEMTG